jgi:hypothetical protein
MDHNKRAVCKIVTIRVELEYAAGLAVRSYTHNASLAGVLSKFGDTGLHFPQNCMASMVRIGEADYLAFIVDCCRDSVMRNHIRQHY